MSAQSLEALANANRIRLDAAQVKREVRAGVLAVTDAIHDPRAGSLTIDGLLKAQPHWGPQRVRNALRDLRWATYGPRAVDLWPTQRLRDLTGHQRHALSLFLGGEL